MEFHLVCVHPFQNPQTGKIYERGQKVTDPDEVGALQDDRDHHFVRVPAPKGK